ncbi:uncharacterized protein LOC112600545 [Melanaphis sacchari]|uniref:uncharacterized protein LOC112600545 n=1 Tax=Melanaphis sacchari TaxID=742174 RepID=UPI000DC157BD|nr:uncharacterized protein LOC112600545 [Melanaphis sacchari]
MGRRPIANNRVRRYTLYYLFHNYFDFVFFRRTCRYWRISIIVQDYIDIKWADTELVPELQLHVPNWFPLEKDDSDCGGTCTDTDLAKNRRNVCPRHLEMQVKLRTVVRRQDVIY